MGIATIDPSIGHYALRASVVVLVFTGARRPLLLKSSILATNKSLKIFSITKMAAKRSQRAMQNGQYRVFKCRPSFTKGAFHYAKDYGNFGRNSNGKVRFGLF